MEDWKTRVCAWAEGELSAEAYANFLMGWANGERWASRKAEAYSAAAIASRMREMMGAADGEK